MGNPLGGRVGWCLPGWLRGRRRVREVVHEPGTGSHAWALQCRFEYADQIRDSLVALAGSHRRFEPDKGGGLVLAEAPDTGEIIERVAALDVGKVELVCCVRVPDEGTPARRMQEVSTHSTMTRSLLSMSGRLRCLGVTRVVMEATSDYWKPPVYLLEAPGFDVWLVNARDVKHLPGRLKPTGWTRCGCARSPNGTWSARVSSCRRRSASCVISPCTGPAWWPHVLPRSSARRSLKPSASSCRMWLRLMRAGPIRVSCQTTPCSGSPDPRPKPNRSKPAWRRSCVTTSSWKCRGTKTLITCGRTQAARFLGYEITVQHNDRKATKGKRSVNGRIALRVPRDVIKAKSAPYLKRGNPAERSFSGQRARLHNRLDLWS